MIAAVLLAALAAVPSTCPRTGERCDAAARGNRVCSYQRSGVACFTATDVVDLFVDYEWQGIPTLPSQSPTARASNYVGGCRVWVDAGTANGCDFRCLLPDGGPLCSTLTDPHTATCVDSPWGKAYDITAASQAPTCVSAILDPIFEQVPSTVMAVGYGRSDAGHNINWWMDRFDGTGATGYMQFYWDGSGDESGSAAAFWCIDASGSSAAGVANSMRDGYGVVSCSTDGEIWDAGPNGGAEIGTGLTVTSTHGGLRRAMKVGVPFTFGANDSHNATRYVANGPMVSFDFWSDHKQAAWRRDRIDEIMGVSTDAGWVTPLQSSTVQGETEDWSATTGNFEPLWTPTLLIDPTMGGGLRTFKDHRNLSAPTNALDPTTMTAIGIPVVNANTSSGAFAVQTKTVEMAETVCASPGCGWKTPERFNNTDGGFEPSWYYFMCPAKAGLTGVSRDEISLNMYTDGTILQLDGGTGGVCLFTGLTSAEGYYSCQAKVTGASTVKWGFTVPLAGSVQTGGCQSYAGPNAEPPARFSTTRPNTKYTLDVSKWPTFDGGISVEIGFTLGWSSSQYTTGFSGGTAYLFDSYLVDAGAGVLADDGGTPSSDHCVAAVINYDPGDGGGAGNHLCTFRNGKGDGANDLLSSGHPLLANTPYAIRCEAKKHVGLPGKCDLYMYLNACTGTKIDGGAGCTHPSDDATTLISSVVDGSRGCPCTPDNAVIGARFTPSDVANTSAAYHTIRVSKPR